MKKILLVWIVSALSTSVMALTEVDQRRLTEQYEAAVSCSLDIKRENLTFVLMSPQKKRVPFSLLFDRSAGREYSTPLFASLVSKKVSETMSFFLFTKIETGSVEKNKSFRLQSPEINGFWDSTVKFELKYNFTKKRIDGTFSLKGRDEDFDHYALKNCQLLNGPQ